MLRKGGTKTGREARAPGKSGLCRWVQGAASCSPVSLCPLTRVGCGPPTRWATLSLAPLHQEVSTGSVTPPWQCSTARPGHRACLQGHQPLLLHQDRVDVRQHRMQAEALLWALGGAGPSPLSSQSRAKSYRLGDRARGGSREKTRPGGPCREAENPPSPRVTVYPAKYSIYREKVPPARGARSGGADGPSAATREQLTSTPRALKQRLEKGGLRKTSMAPARAGEAGSPEAQLLPLGVKGREGKTTNAKRTVLPFW